MKAKFCTGRYGKLLAIESAEPHVEVNGRKRRTTKCICDCGKTIIIQNQSLINGSTKSCGCGRSENMTRIATKHGLSKSHRKEYFAWCGMLNRCRNHEEWGGRGITFDPAWSDFAQFLKDMGPADQHLSLDRIDNDGNYEKSNCRWTTSLIQNNNRRPRRWAKKPEVQQSPTKLS